MDDKKIENMLRNMANEPLPDDITEIAKNKSDEFTNEITVQKQNIWRIIMNSKMTKYAAAAVILLATSLTITLFNQTIPTAYAIEQTIEAIDKVDSVYVEQVIREEGTSLNTKMWAQRGSDGKFFFGNFRQESGDDGYTIIANESENRTYYYDPSDKRVRVYERLNITIGDFLDKDYFLFLQQEMENVKLAYGKDKTTDKDVIILKYQLPLPSKYDKSITKSQIITFDLETKLPIHWVSWDNPYFKGEPYSEWTLIEYDPELPEDIFKFKIPENAKVIHEPSN